MAEADLDPDRGDAQLVREPASEEALFEVAEITVSAFKTLPEELDGRNSRTGHVNLLAAMSNMLMYGWSMAKGTVWSNSRIPEITGRLSALWTAENSTVLRFASARKIHPLEVEVEAEAIGGAEAEAIAEAEAGPEEGEMRKKQTALPVHDLIETQAPQRAAAEVVVPGGPAAEALAVTQRKAQAPPLAAIRPEGTEMDPTNQSRTAAWNCCKKTQH